MLLLDPVPRPGAPPRGVRLLLLATPASGVGRARDVGTHGATKLPYRSFRFGTRAP